VRVPAFVSTILHYFRGRRVEEAIEAIAMAHGVDVSRELVRELVDYEVLVPD
jgi:hypothetical protein